MPRGSQSMTHSTPRVPPLVMLAGSVTLLFSGCLSSDGPESSTATNAGPEADYDAESCGLVGFVVDDARLPVEGARVSLAGQDLAAETLASGGYAFDNLPPGHYYVKAHQKGHDDAVTPEAVACEAGGEAEAPPLVLVSTGVTEDGFQTPVHRRGVVRCGGHVASTSLANTCNSFSVHLPAAPPNPLPPADPTSVPVEPGRVTAAVVELAWEPSVGLVGPQALRVQLPAIADHVAWTYETGGQYQALHDEANHTRTISVSGASPLRLRLDVPLEAALWSPQPSAEPHMYFVRDFIPDTPVPNAALLVDQRFDLYVTYFYNDQPAPPDYTMLPA